MPNTPDSPRAPVEDGRMTDGRKLDLAAAKIDDMAADADRRGHHATAKQHRAHAADLRSIAARLRSPAPAPAPTATEGDDVIEELRRIGIERDDELPAGETGWTVDTEDGPEPHGTLREALAHVERCIRHEERQRVRQDEAPTEVERAALYRIADGNPRTAEWDTLDRYVIRLRAALSPAAPRERPTEDESDDGPEPDMDAANVLEWEAERADEEADELAEMEHVGPEYKRCRDKAADYRALAKRLREARGAAPSETRDA